VEIAGSNSTQYFIFFQHFCASFNPGVAVLLEYLDTQGWFFHYNLIAVSAI